MIVVVFGYSQINRDDDKAKPREDRSGTGQIKLEANQNEHGTEAVGHAPAVNSADKRPLFSLGSLACPPDKECREKENQSTANK